MFPSVLAVDRTHNAENSGSSLQIPSLCNLCARVLVQDLASASAAVDVLPAKLLSLLLKYAIELQDYNCVRIIIFGWRSSVLKMSDLRLEIAYKDDECIKRVGAYIIHSFIDALKNRADFALRTIDLRGYALSSETLHYLCAHGILAYNEQQRNKLLSAVQLTIDKGKLNPAMASVFGDLKPTTTLPSNDYQVIIDVYLCDALSGSSDLFANVCKALHISNLINGEKDSSGPLVRLKVNSVQMNGLIHEQHKILLDLLANKQHMLLTGLSVQLSSLHGQQISFGVSRFANLCALEISDCLMDDALVDYLRDHLPQLTHLSRLSLAGTDLGAKLKLMLDSCKAPLQYLDIRSCRLQALDLIHLSNSPHTTTLKYLNISDNTLGRHLTNVCCLLKSARATVTHLAINCGRFTDENLERLVVNCAMIPQLQYLSVAYNDWYSVELVRRIISQHLAPHPTLQMLKISLPNELHVDFVQGGAVHLHQVAMCVQLENNFQNSLNNTVVELMGDRQRPLEVSLTPPTDSYPDGLEVVFPNVFDEG